jgi:hypothetical protein
MKKYKQTTAGNYTVSSDNHDDFYISFRSEKDNAQTHQFGMMISELAVKITGNEAYKDSNSETALIDKKRRYNGYKYYVLKGDFRGAYLELVSQGFDACLSYYNEQKNEHESVWSDTHIEDEQEEMNNDSK